MRKLFFAILIGFLLFSFNQKLVSAQDVWVYGDGDVSYWIQDETIQVNPYTVTLKTVYQGKCMDQVTWTFANDEGYLFANNHNQQYTIVIYEYPNSLGTCHVENRSELLATYRWLINQNIYKTH